MIDIIKKGDIDAVFSHEHRQYFVGNLHQPQELKHIFDDKVEMGMSYFDKYSSEKPHYHPIATEYQIVLSGKSKYVDIEKNIEYSIEQGDVFVIRPNTTYIQKAIKGTTILFFKHPGGNDKTLVDVTKKMSEWCAEWSAKWK